MGMPADPAAGGICPEVEENKNKGLLERGRSRVPDGRGMGAAASPQAQGGTQRPLPGAEGVDGLHRGLHGGVPRPCSGGGSGVSAPTPHTPLSTTEPPALGVHVSP